MSAVGYAVLPTTISLSGLSSELQKQVLAPAQKAAKQAAESIEKGIGGAVETASKDVARAQRIQEKASAAVAKAEGEVTRAKVASEAATSKVKIAELDRERAVSQASSRLSKAESDYQRLLGSGKSSAEDLARAEEKVTQVRLQGESDVLKKETTLAEARQRSVDSAGRLEAKERDLAGAQEKSKDSADNLLAAQKRLKDAQGQTDDAADKSKTAFQKLREQIGLTGAEMDATGGKSAILGDKLMGGLKTIGTGALLGVGAKIGSTITDGIGTAFSAGFSRLQSVEQAEKMLQGLGHTTEATAGILDNAMQSVKGTAFGFGEAASMAATFVGAGIPEGEELTRVLTLVGDSAAIAGADFQEMGSIWTKVASGQRMGTEELNQLMDRGLGLLPELQKKYGVTAEEARKMITEGKVSFEDFADVMENMVGGSAQSMGETFGGSLSNMQAALGRLGAKFLEPVFENAPAIFSAVGGAVDTLGEKLDPLIASWSERMQPVFERFADWIGPALEKSIDGIADGLAAMVGWVKDNATWLKPLAAAAAGVATAWGLWTAATNAHRLATVAWTTAVKMAAAAQRVFNAVINANKLMLIVTAIGAVVGALVYFFTQTETGRKLWEKFTTALGDGWDWVVEKFNAGWNWIRDNVFNPLVNFTTGTILPALQGAWDGIKAAWDAVVTGFQWAYDNVLKPVFDGFVTVGTYAAAIIGTVVLAPILLAWKALSAAISWGWTTLIKPTWEAMSAGAMWLWEHGIKPALEWISGKWDWLKLQVQKFIFEINRNIYLFQSAVADLWNAYVSPILTWISTKWDELKNLLIAAYNTIKSSVIDAFSNALTWFRDNVVGPVINFFVEKWEWLRTKLHDGWTWIDSNVIAAFRTGLEGFKSFFDSIVDGIGRVWESLRGKLAKPINFMIGTVYNDGILKAWNIIADILPGLKKGSPLAGIPEHATGGRIVGPGTGTSDDVLMWGSNGEHMMTALEVKRIGGHDHVYAMREAIRTGHPFVSDGRGGITVLPQRMDNRAGDLAGAAPDLMLPAFKDGGEIQPLWKKQLAAAHRFAQAQHGKPYQWAGPNGPGSSFDCSGFMGSIGATIQGANPWQRYWATMSFANGRTAQGFVPGLGPGFSIGVFNGGPYGGHTAGTLSAVDSYPTVNVESGGSPSMVKYGVGAVGADHGQFTHRYHLPIGADGAFVSGGAGGFDFLGAVKKWIADKTEGIFSAVRGHVDMPSPPPEWLGVPGASLKAGVEAFKDYVADTVSNLGHMVSGVWGRITDLFDNGGVLEHGRMAINRSGRPEIILTNAQWRIFGKSVQALVPATEALNQAAQGLQDWARATEEQDRMGYPHEWAIHFGSEAASTFADDALSLVGLGGIVGGQLKPSLVNLLNTGADNLNDVYGTRFGHVSGGILTPVSLLDDEGRAVGTKLTPVEQHPATDVAAAAGGVDATSTTATVTEPPVKEITFEVKGDAVTTEKVSEMFDQLNGELGDTKVRLKKIEDNQTASVTSGVAGIV